MPTFTLETAFTEQDLQRFLASGSNVVVAKPFELLGADLDRAAIARLKLVGKGGVRLLELLLGVAVELPGLTNAVEDPLVAAVQERAEGAVAR